MCLLVNCLQAGVQAAEASLPCINAKETDLQVPAFPLKLAFEATSAGSDSLLLLKVFTSQDTRIALNWFTNVSLLMHLLFFHGIVKFARSIVIHQSRYKSQCCSLHHLMGVGVRNTRAAAAC